MLRHEMFGNRGLMPERLESRYLLATVSLAPTIDNSLFEDNSGTLSNGAGQHLFAGRTDVRAGTVLRRALVQFDLSDAIPAGATVLNVELKLNVSRTPTPQAQPISLHRVTSAWGEGTSDASGAEGQGATATRNDATWIHARFPNSNWQNEGGDFVSSPSSSRQVGNLGSYTWTGNNMKDDVDFWLQNPAQNFGWILIGDESRPGSAKRFDSSEHATAANRPELIIEYEALVATPPWQNPELPEDVNGDGLIVPFDALLIINAINTGQSSELPAPTDDQPPPYLDVNGDGQLSPIDALMVINLINGNANQPAAEPNAEFGDALIAAAIDASFADDEAASE